MPHFQSGRQSRFMSSLGRKVEIVTYTGIFKAMSNGPRMIDCKLLCCISFWLHLQLKMAAIGVFEGEKPFCPWSCKNSPHPNKINVKRLESCLVYRLNSSLTAAASACTDFTRHARTCAGATAVGRALGALGWLPRPLRHVVVLTCNRF